MLSHTEHIDEFHLRLSRTEKELYEEFLKTEEAALALEMQQYFTQAKGHAGGIRFDHTSLWSKIEKRVGVWFAEVPRTRAGMPRTLSSSETSPGLLETLITC